MLLNGNRAEKIPHYRRTATISVSLYVETKFREYRVIRGLTVNITFKLLSICFAFVFYNMNLLLYTFFLILRSLCDLGVMVLFGVQQS